MGAVAGDLAGATHVLGADGLVALAGATPELGIDLTRRYGAVPAGPAEPRDLVRRTFVTLAAAEAAGVARWCLETAVDYAKVREQFGQKIGAFQAIKHLCAEMLETSEAVTAAAWDVASVCPECARRRRPVGVRRRRGRGDLLRRRRRGRQVVHPGARRHRVHLRARRAPLPAPGPRAARTGRRRRRGRPAVDRTFGQRHTPARGRRPAGPRRGRSARGAGGRPSGSERSPRTSAAARWSRPAT